MARYLTDQEKIEIVEKYKTGNYNCCELAREYNKHNTSINDLLRRRGIVIRNNHSELARKYNVNENYFNEINSEDKAYFLGFLYADGCNHGNSIELSLKGDDKSILNKLKEKIEYDGPLLFYIRKDTGKLKKRNECRLNINNKKISEDLKRLGCVPRKTFILEFPTEEQVPKYLIQHFVRGYLDGDGCISRSGRRCCVSFASTKNFCLGLKSNIKDITNIDFNIYPHKNIFNCCISCISDILIFLKWLYKDSTIYLERKYKKYLEIKEKKNEHYS